MPQAMQEVVHSLFPVEELRTRMDDAKEQLSMEDDLVRFVTQDMQTEDVVTEGNDCLLYTSESPVSERRAD